VFQNILVLHFTVTVICNHGSQANIVLCCCLIFGLFKEVC